MTTYTIEPHKLGYKIVAAWTEQRAVNTRTRHAFRAVAQTAAVYFTGTLAEAEKEVARLQSRDVRRAA